MNFFFFPSWVGLAIESQWLSLSFSGCARVESSVTWSLNFKFILKIANIFSSEEVRTNFRLNLIVELLWVTLTVGADRPEQIEHEAKARQGWAVVRQLKVLHRKFDWVSPSSSDFKTYSYNLVRIRSGVLQNFLNPVKTTLFNDHILNSALHVH